MLDPAPELSPFPLADAADQAAPAFRRPLPIERLGAFIEVFLCSGFPTQLLITGALARVGMDPQAADGGLSPAFVVALALIDMVLVLALVYLFLRAHREPVAQFVRGSRSIWRETMLGVALIPVSFIVVILISVAIIVLKPTLQNVPVNPFERMLQTPRDAVIFAIVVTLAGGVREEIQRAFILRRFDEYLGGGALGIVLYSVAFGVGHLHQGYAAAIITGVLGATWGCVYLARRSVIAPMIGHAGFNLAQVLRYAVIPHP